MNLKNSSWRPIFAGGFRSWVLLTPWSHHLHPGRISFRARRRQLSWPQRWHVFRLVSNRSCPLVAYKVMVMVMEWRNRGFGGRVFQAMIHSLKSWWSWSNGFVLVHNNALDSPPKKVHLFHSCLADRFFFGPLWGELEWDGGGGRDRPWGSSNRGLVWCQHRDQPWTCQTELVWIYLGTELGARCGSSRAGLCILPLAALLSKQKLVHQPKAERWRRGSCEYVKLDWLFSFFSNAPGISPVCCTWD